MLSGDGTESFRNYPVNGLADMTDDDDSMGWAAVFSNKSPMTGTTLSYCWWIVCFQLFGIAYGAFAAFNPSKRLGALALLTVLTTSTFLFTDSVLNAPWGAYAWSHNESGTPASVIGTKGSKAQNSVFVLFSGLIMMDIGNVALLLALGDESAPAAAAPKAAAAAPAEEEAV
jgi:hypothetical protein